MKHKKTAIVLLAIVVTGAIIVSLITNSKNKLDSKIDNGVIDTTPNVESNEKVDEKTPMPSETIISETHTPKPTEDIEDINDINDVDNTEIEEGKYSKDYLMDLWTADIDNPPKTLEDLKMLDKKMTVHDVYKLFGNPNDFFGSGDIGYIYYIEDGSELHIRFNGESGILSANIMNKDGSYEMIIGRE